MSSLVKVVWDLVGKVGFFCAYPAVAFYLGREERARIVIEHDGNVLLVKSWFGDGRWELPGGGIHKGEEPKAGALREIKEELNLTLNFNEISNIRSELFKEKLTKYQALYLGVKIREKPNLKLQRLEISQADWFNSSQIENINMNKAARDVILDWLSGTYKHLNG